MYLSAQPVKVPKETLLITVWGLVGATAAFFVSRIAIRIKFTRRLWIDDAIAAAALVCLFSQTMVITFMADSMYKSLQLTGPPNQSGNSAKPVSTEEEANETVTVFLKMQFTETIMFWTCLWLAKASFLGFYHHFAKHHRPSIVVWRLIAILTALGYIASMVMYPISCSSFEPFHCETSNGIALSLISLRISTVLDVSCDLMIIALTMLLALRATVPGRAKLALYGMFGLGAVVILMAVVRILMATVSSDGRPEVSWLNLWSAAESSMAVIVSNLAVFKYLFKGPEDDSSSGSSSYQEKYVTDEKQHLESLTSPLPQKTYRNSLDLVPTPKSKSKRGLQTHVMAVPPEERDLSQLDHKFGEIVVTREFDQITADNSSVNEGEWPIRKTPCLHTVDAAHERGPQSSTPAPTRPYLPHHSQRHSPRHTSRQRRRSDSSTELILPPVQVDDKDSKIFYFGSL